MNRRSRFGVFSTAVALVFPVVLVPMAGRAAVQSVAGQLDSHPILGGTMGLDAPVGGNSFLMGAGVGYDQTSNIRLVY